MQIRYAMPALVLGLLAFPVLSSQDSTTDRYRFEIETAAVIDLSEMGRGERETTAHVAGELSVTSAEDGGINIVLDNMTRSEDGQQLTPKMLAEMIGTTWTAVLDDKGRLSELQSDAASSHRPTVLFWRGRLEAILRTLFPYIAPGASVGDTWSDTTEYSDSNYRMNYDTKVDPVTGVVDSVLVDSVVSRSGEMTTHIGYTAVADTTYLGVAALAVETTSTITTTGYMERQGGMDIEGTATGTGLLYIGSDGKYLGGVRQLEWQFEMTGRQNPTVIPVTRSTRYTVELLP